MRPGKSALSIRPYRPHIYLIASMRRLHILRALATERPVALPLREGRTMFTAAEQYRAKAVDDAQKQQNGA
jgi:hypothetical protein